MKFSFHECKRLYGMRDAQYCFFCFLSMLLRCLGALGNDWFMITTNGCGTGSPGEFPSILCNPGH
jgi:hypothetical protein